MMKIILTGIFIFIFIILFCAAMAYLFDFFKSISQFIEKRKCKKIKNEINGLTPNQIRAILGFNPINHPKYKTAREMLENWPEGCPKPTNDEIRKYFGFQLEKEENDGN